MKKIAIFLSLLMCTLTIFAQDDFESLKNKKEKSDQEILDEKKKEKSGTWENRGNLYMDVYQVNTKSLYVGMPAKQEQNPFNNAELLVGKPLEIKNLGNNKEEWIYKRFILTFENSSLVSWKETQILDSEALNKSYDALNKAIELDNATGKGKLKSKSSMMGSIARLRDLYLNKAIEDFNNKENKTALFNIEKAIELGGYPRDSKDTTFKMPEVTYYAAIIADNAQEYEKAKTHYSNCIKLNHQADFCYHYLSNIYKQQGDDAKCLETIKEGYSKYPKSKELLIDLINFYLGSNQSEEALKYIDKAIADDPANPSFHYAKGTLYNRILIDTTKTLTNEQTVEYFDLAVKNYNKAIELDSKFFDAYYNVGALYYNEAARIIKLAQNIPQKEIARYNAELDKANVKFKEALPYMEKAHEIDPKDISTLQTLATIYLRLQMYDKQKETKAKIEALKG